jgi:hypothetical protein
MSAIEKCPVDASLDAWPVRRALHGRWAFLAAAVGLAVALGTIAFFLLRLGFSPWPMGKPGALLAGGAVTILCMATLAAAIHVAIEMISPTIELRGPSVAAMPGQRLIFAWRLVRPGTGIEGFTIAFEAYEERRTGEGFRDPWRRTLLLTRSLTHSRVDLRPDAGLFTVDIPAEAQPTITRPDFRRRWIIRIEGRVRWLPDLRQTYQLDITGSPEVCQSLFSSSRAGRSCRCKRRPRQIDRRRSRQTSSLPRRIRPGL